MKYFAYAALIAVGFHRWPGRVRRPSICSGPDNPNLRPAETSRRNSISGQAVDKIWMGGGASRAIRWRLKSNRT